jgi:hypothetical protein
MYFLKVIVITVLAVFYLTAAHPSKDSHLKEDIETVSILAPPLDRFKRYSRSAAFVTAQNAIKGAVVFAFAAIVSLVPENISF